MGRKILLVLALWGAAFASTLATESAFSLDSKPARRNATARVAFEPNQGQTDPQVRFLARDRNSVLFLTEQAALLKLRTRVKAGAQAHRNHPVETVLRFSWMGTSAAPILYPEERLAGEVNYFRGVNSSRGKPAITRLPTFARITYRTLYPGVDLSFHSKRGFLEFDFIVAPHGNLSQIGYSIEGADGIRLDANGDLVLMADGGEIRKHKPIAYQSINSKRRSVPAKYVVHGARIGFAVGAYDTTRPLVIDPAISYSTYIGGSDGDDARAITVDSSGRAYIAGRTISADFPTKNAFQPTRNSLQESCGSDATSFQQEAFVTKLWATGGGLIYSTYLGGENDDTALGIAVDSSGHAYVTGQTCSREFPITPGAAQTALHGTTDAFITKLSASGSALLYSTYLGGADDDGGAAIALDGSKRAYVAGFTTSTDFPLKDPFQAALGGGIDAFVTRLSADGKSLSYSTYLGGNDADSAGGIAVDDSNRAYVTGNVRSTNFPTTPGAFRTSNAGEEDAFVTKLWATGAGLIYSTYLGGTANDLAFDVAVDSSGRAYVTGRTTSLDFPVTASSFQRQRRSGPDAFVTRLSASGSGLSYSTYLGGNGGEEGRAITVNSLGQAHVTGQTNSPDFPTKNRVQSFNRGANSLQNDAFVTKLWANGAGLHYSTYLGGRLSDGGNGISLDNSGNAYVTGTTGSEDFPTTSGAFQRTFKGFLDAFVTKIAP